MEQASCFAMKDNALKSAELCLLIAESHPDTTKSLLALLADVEGVAVVGTVQHTLKALTLMSALRPDVLLLDADLTNGRLAQVLRSLHAVNPETRIIVLTHEDPALLDLVCRAAGAVQVFSKTADLHALAETLSNLAHKGKLLCEEDER